MAGKNGKKVNPQRERQRFTMEFKLEAVRQLVGPGSNYELIEPGPFRFQAISRWGKLAARGRVC
jgi:transposase-like protein